MRFLYALFLGGVLGAAQRRTPGDSDEYNFNAPCEMDKPPEGGMNACTWTVTTQMQLNFWARPRNYQVSICVAKTENLLKCQIMCESSPECMSVHFCRRCQSHNCRLLREAEGGPSGLRIVSKYRSRVDLGLKGLCV